MAHKILWNPVRFVEERKSKRYDNEGYYFMFGSSLIFSLTILLIAYKLTISNVVTFSTKELVIMTLSSFASSYLMYLLIAYFLKELVDVSYSRFNYERAVAVIGYTSFLLASGFAISVIISLIPGQLSLLLMAMVIPLFIIKAYALFLRSLALYARMNLVESFIISFILLTALMMGMALSNYIYFIMQFNPTKFLA